MIERSVVFQAPRAMFISNAAVLIGVFVTTRLSFDHLEFALQQPREWILKFLFLRITIVENLLRWVAFVFATGLVG